MNLYEQQASNRHKTWAIMCVFVAFLFLQRFWQSGLAAGGVKQ